MVWVSLPLCQCKGTCICFGARMRSSVAWVGGSTRKIAICGDASPSSGMIGCHFASSYLMLTACLALVAVTLGLVAPCPVSNAGTRNAASARAILLDVITFLLVV